MAAAPMAQSWADLPAACLREVFCRVPCLVDRHSAFRACPRWLAALRPPALPWLLFPAPNPMGSPSLVCVHEDEDRHLPTRIPHGARCFGCHEGDWLFLGIRDPLGHKLFNIRTGAILDLPVYMNIDLDLSPLLPSTLVFPMTTVHGVALSAAPDDERCVALCIVTTTSPPWARCVARWRMGQQLAFEIRPQEQGVKPPKYNFVDAEDLVYHDGSFHLLLRRSEDMWVCTPEVLPNSVEWEKRSFFHPGRLAYDYDDVVRGRYLVSSRGQLLMVVRFAPRAQHTSTSKFKAFRAIPRPYQMPEVDPLFEWSQLDSLDGRILFVGCGCSRSYELNDAQGRIQYKGFKADIYFFDNQEFYFLDAEQYLCSDNGRWSEPDGVQRCFPAPRADPSWISPPAWLLP